jgi:hypothetical protein
MYKKITIYSTSSLTPEHDLGLIVCGYVDIILINLLQKIIVSSLGMLFILNLFALPPIFVFFSFILKNELQQNIGIGIWQRND